MEKATVVNTFEKPILGLKKRYQNKNVSASFYDLPI